VILSLVAPGNPHPVIENPEDPEISLKGKAILKGYQSHFSIGMFSHFPFIHSIHFIK